MAFKTEESVFNMAMAYLQRIDKILFMAQDTAIRGDIDGWLSHLRALRREISVKIKPEESELLDQKLLEINKMLADHRFKVMNKGLILSKLDEMDIFMRRIMQDRGMLLPSKNDPRFAILEH